MADQQQTTGPFAFIGDLHGRAPALKSILLRDKGLKYHYVFLGDILHHKPHFTRSKRISPVRILSMVHDLIGKNKATLILGNNENYILQSLVCDEDKIKKREARYTMKCLKQLPLAERISYINMLSNAPTYAELGNRYRVAHAYYPHAGVQIPRSQIIAGPGYLWFKDKDLEGVHNIDPNYTYFFGHYGLPYRRRNVNILDVTSLEGVGVYYSDIDEFMVQY